MKRLSLFLLILSLCACALLLTACGAGSAEDNTAAATTAPAATAAPLTPELDLSGMSGTVVYAQVLNMVTTPTDYVGQIVRISGLFDVFEGDEQVYFACVIPDATACCAQGMEFVWAGDHRYPEDYPEPGTDVTVTGRFEIYYEGEWQYIHLVDAEVVWGE